LKFKQSKGYKKAIQNPIKKYLIESNRYFSGKTFFKAIIKNSVVAIPKTKTIVFLTKEFLFENFIILSSRKKPKEQPPNTLKTLNTDFIFISPNPAANSKIFKTTSAIDVTIKDAKTNIERLFTFLLISSSIKYIIIEMTNPIANPPITSISQWTLRYNLESATSADITSANITRLIFL